MRQRNMRDEKEEGNEGRGRDGETQKDRERQRERQPLQLSPPWCLFVQLVVLLFWRDISSQEALRIRLEARQRDVESAARAAAKETQLTTQTTETIKETETDICETAGPPDIRLLFLRTRHVPWLMFVSHCITFCGAGKP